jgi:hypothetical protein
MGIRMHSGWGVLIVVSFPHSVEVLDRRRVIASNPAAPGAKQPYHHARTQLEEVNLEEAERYLENCSATCEQLAMAAVEEAVVGVRGRGYRIVGSAILEGAGRGLPSLSEILASHLLIHSAEGEFFSRTATKACERMNIPVTAIRRHDLEERVKTTLGGAAAQVKRTVQTLGKSIGPPWTADHKDAALAAVTLLARTNRRSTRFV